MRRLSRRGVLASTAALAACGRKPPEAQAEVPHGPPPELRQIAPFPMGVAVRSAYLDQQPSYAALVASQFSQVTPDFELKMEVVLKDDGAFDFARPDRIAAFVQAHGQRLHGHTLVWYAQDPTAFHPLDGNPAAFARALDRYILAVMGRYRGVARTWDVVNEPVAEDGEGLRPCLWSRNLGQEDYILHAFRTARAADPGAVLVLNDYAFETKPRKLATFMALVDRLRARGAPIDAVGTQGHVNVDLLAGAFARSLGELARLGLPIHVSEFDCSLRSDNRFDLRSRAERVAVQARIYREAMEAFLALPPAQRLAFTLWGARDRDSWLREPPNAGDGADAPLAFDDAGRPKQTFWALADALSRG